MKVNYEIITVFQCYDYLDLLDFPSDTYVGYCWGAFDSLEDAEAEI